LGVHPYRERTNGNGCARQTAARNSDLSSLRWEFRFSFDSTSLLANTASLAGWNQTKAGSLPESKSTLTQLPHFGHWRGVKAAGLLGFVPAL